jgi:hypothetical protein
MNNTPSLADRAISALAAVARMDADVTNEHDERHHIRSLKRIAEQGLIEAFRNASELAYTAEDMHRSGEKTREAAEEQK